MASETKSSEINDLVSKRLDMVFDLASEKKIKLLDEDIRVYGEFCHNNLKEILGFIQKVSKEKNVFLCSPVNYNPYAFGDQYNIVPIIHKCQITDFSLHSIVIKEESLFYRNGFDMRIKDKYVMVIEKLSGDLSELHIELFSDDVLRLKNRGSIIDYYGDIISLTPEN